MASNKIKFLTILLFVQIFLTITTATKEGNNGASTFLSFLLFLILGFIICDVDKCLLFYNSINSINSYNGKKTTFMKIINRLNYFH